jgi:hypothetical protein
MLKRIIVLIAIAVTLFSCAKKSTEWKEKHVLQLSQTFALVGNPVDLDIADNKVYIAEDQGGLSIIDLTNNTKKWITSIISQDNDEVSLIKTRRISVDLAMKKFFINETVGSDEIRVVDFTNPDSLVIVDRFSGGTQDINQMKFQKNDNIGAQFVYEGIICVGTKTNYGKYGVHDVGFPPYFAVTVPVENPATSRGAVLTGQYIYSAVEQRGLAIASRSSGAIVGQLDLPGEAQKVIISGNYAYLACRQAGLQIVDITNPASPVKVGSYDTSGYATNLAIWENYVAVSSGGSGIYLFDVTNKANPILKDNITSCGYVNDVRFNNGKVIVASRDQGLLVYNLVP